MPLLLMMAYVEYFRDSDGREFILFFFFKNVMVESRLLQ